MAAEPTGTHMTTPLWRKEAWALSPLTELLADHFSLLPLPTGRSLRAEVPLETTWQPRGPGESFQPGHVGFLPWQLKEKPPDLCSGGNLSNGAFNVT